MELSRKKLSKKNNFPFFIFCFKLKNYFCTLLSQISSVKEGTRRVHIFYNSKKNNYVKEKKSRRQI